MFLSMLKSRREMFNWENERERSLFFNDFEYFAENWEGQLPNLRDIFRRGEIDWLLTQCAIHYNEDLTELAKPIYFVIRCGYKDEPDVDEGKKPSLRRTTPVHYAGGRRLTCLRVIIHKLFQIYNRFDMNYANEYGLTHFHVACQWDCEDVVEKFLELGQDPNCLVPRTGDSPLHLALKHTNVKIFELLLRNGANPNLANIKYGSTPLHVIVEKTNGIDLTRMLFELSEEKYQPLQIDARDKFGYTPLRRALTLSGKKQIIEMLLRNGADPNSTNEYGSTFLHILCHRRFKLEGFSLETLFEACDNTQKTLQVDAVDNLGRTPLQWAVANFLPRMVNLLLDHGANVSKFIFPTESYYGDLSILRFFDSLPNFELRLAICALMIVERLENRGYELGQNAASTIMKFFAKLKMFEKSVDLQKCWYDDEDFANKARAIMIRDNDQSLSLYDLSRLPPAEAAKRLKYEDYYDFLCSDKLDELIERHKLAYTLDLCEKLSRGFFRRWALELFMELTHYQLPILCCEKIIANLMNQDLSHICLAATDQSLEKSVKND